VKVDTGIMAAGLDDIAHRAKELEALGYDGLITAETGSDPFLPLVIAAEHTERIQLGTGIAVAFARTPMLPKPYSTDAPRALLKRRTAAAPLADWRRPPPLDLRCCYTGFGSSVVDHSATSARSRNVTVIWPVAPSKENACGKVHGCFCGEAGSSCKPP